jgi:hypothetical protein
MLVVDTGVIGSERAGQTMCYETVHMRLWIDPDSEPITGWVVAEDGEREEFAGWVELTAAIESARRELSRAAPRTAEGR